MFSTGSRYEPARGNYLLARLEGMVERGDFDRLAQSVAFAACHLADGGLYQPDGILKPPQKRTQICDCCFLPVEVFGIYGPLNQCLDRRNVGRYIRNAAPNMRDQHVGGNRAVRRNFGG